MILPTTCSLCPRRCGANRATGERGVCGADDTLRVARAALHHWEEPPISGTKGSGTVFFSNCPLHCVYCQNEPISSGRAGKAVSTQRLARIFLELQAQGAHNINLVTPTQYVPQIISALDLARAEGLALPIVYNTGGYETVDTIECLKGYVDIYLTDFKYASAALATRYSNAPDYPAVALLALKAMVEQVGEYAEAEILQKGVIVRHLMLPGRLEDSKAAIQTVYDAVADKVCYSLMNQYTPIRKPGSLWLEIPISVGFLSQTALNPSGKWNFWPESAQNLPEIGISSQTGDRGQSELSETVSEEDYDTLIDFALDLGIGHSFMQEGGTAEESFIPAFDLTGVE